jgi:hypothetical protein
LALSKPSFLLRAAGPPTTMAKVHFFLAGL